jgi:polysaccharide deacetylase 2 family uncharacterized protein YibQ
MASSRKKKKKASSRKGTPARIKLFVGLLIVLLLAGVVAVKYFKSTPGKALLLDSGFTGYYEQIQDAAGRELRAALAEAGLGESIKERRRTIKVGSRKAVSLEWELFCGERCDLLGLNLALTGAVRRAGLRVRESSERAEGTELRFEAGTRRYRTHLIIIHSGRRPPSAEKTPGPKLAIVIDDFGYARNDRIEAFFNLNIPLTLSILPSLPHPQYATGRAAEAGKEVLLHLPMEAMQESRSDMEVVRVDMSTRRIRSLVERYAREIPGISGVNNHQGSRATQDKRVMKAVMAVLKKRNLFFFDSLTSPKSIAYNTAKQEGVAAARNDLFLDAETEDPAVIVGRLERLMALAKRNGQAIAIGHPKAWTLEALTQCRTIADAAGVQLVTVSELISN